MPLKHPRTCLCIHQQRTTIPRGASSSLLPKTMPRCHHVVRIQRHGGYQHRDNARWVQESTASSPAKTPNQALRSKLCLAIYDMLNHRCRSRQARHHGRGLPLTVRGSGPVGSSSTRDRLIPGTPSNSRSKPSSNDSGPSASRHNGHGRHSPHPCQKDCYCSEFNTRLHCVMRLWVMCWPS